GAGGLWRNLEERSRELTQFQAEVLRVVPWCGESSHEAPPAWQRRPQAGRVVRRAAAELDTCLEGIQLARDEVEEASDRVV
ncbi:MAG TPA: hypothetical protein VI197_15415, partial [Polyangiaceae bacterium]